MSKCGNLIVLEGPDGVGKSTLTSALVDRLCEFGIPCHAYAFPGNEPRTLGSLVYRLHHKDEALGVDTIAPIALQAAHIAAHMDAIERVFRPKLESGENIVLDRYWWSTAIYGALGGAPRDILEGLIAAERLCWRALQPLMVFLIDRHQPWRKSEDSPAWHDLAREYKKLADKEQVATCVEVIQNDIDPIDVVTGMVNILIKKIDGGNYLPPDNSERNATQLNLEFGGKTTSTFLAPTFTIIQNNELKPTKVFDTYWRFAFERQEIFFRRLEGRPPPWSSDPILQRHRFTNSYRASDRVSQYLIRNVQYTSEQQPEELFFRTMLFKIFNRIDTWELLERSLGGLHAAEFKPSHYEKVLNGAQQAKKRIYSAAYIMPPAPGSQGHAKHVGHLLLLRKMLRDDLPHKLADASSLKHAFEILRAYPMMGDFLAFQYIIDLNYSQLLNYSEMDFVVPGPGAKRGIQKCFSNPPGLSDAEMIRRVAEIQSEEFLRRGLAFRDLWGRPLQLVDCQNLFCEVDKYARVAHPDMTSQGGRTRIKQIFHTSGRLNMPWYPPKWKLNEKILLDGEIENESN
jgi:thymidylate kinase